MSNQSSIVSADISSILVTICSIGLFYCSYRLVLAMIQKRVRALTKFYTRNEEKVEFYVWMTTYFCLAVTFLAILGMFFARSVSQPAEADQTKFYISIILILQFSALIAFVPFLVRMIGSKSKSKGGNSRQMIQELKTRTSSLIEAKKILDTDYELDSENKQMDLIISTFYRKTNSSALIRIESKNDVIQDIY